MRKSFLTLAFFLFLAKLASAQCTPDLTLVDPGLYPEQDSLPCIVINQPYSETIYFKNFNTIFLPGVPIPFTVDYIQIDSINNLPCGITWVTNKPNNTFNNQESGCIQVSGITTDTAGQYNLDIWVTVLLVGGNPFQINASAADLSYAVRVRYASEPCPPVDTLPTAIVQTACNNAAVLPPLPSGPCSEIFFSEYVEGTSNNKAVEVYNPTPDTINLSNYQFMRLNGGSTVVNTYVFSKMLPPGGTYVIANSQSDPAILAVADTTSAFTNFNGDDALMIVRIADGDTLDIFGTWGIDPGTNWPIGGGAGSTLDYTLVRKPTVQEGQTDWNIGQNEWTVFPVNTFTELGSHTMIPCGVTIDPQITLPVSALTVVESVGTVDFIIERSLPNGMASQVQVAIDINASTATLGVDFLFNDTLITFPGDTDLTRVLSVTIIDDTDPEATEQIVIRLSNPVNAQLVDSVFTLTILDNDAIAGVGCSDLFFSEYIEGTGQNKAVEIYNPTSGTIDLTTYYITYHSSASVAATDTHWLSGTLAAGAVYIISTDQANQAILNVANDTLAFPSVVHFSGDDALLLWNGSTLLDKIGDNDGNDPGTNWPVGSGATSEYTLVRKSNIQTGQPVWAIGATEWDVYPQNTFTYIGSHSMIPCGIGSGPVLSFSQTAITVSESVGSVNLTVNILNPDANPTEVDVVVVGGTATSGVDYIFNDTTLVFPANSSAPITISIQIIDDAIQEIDETIVVRLQDPTNNATLFDSVMTILILDNDAPIPAYTIAQVSGVDANCVMDSAGVVCKLRGVIHGPNRRASGYQVEMIDATDGITLFAFNDIGGLILAEGDSVEATGTITQFNGLKEIIADTLIRISQFNDLRTPLEITALDESTEGKYLLFKRAWLVDATAWTGTGAGFNVLFTNGSETIEVRIDNDVPFYSIPPITDTVDIYGTGGQFDNTLPYCEGYQFHPSKFVESTDSIDFVHRPKQLSAIRLYPNPASAVVMIESEELFDAVEIYDLAGRLTRNINAGQVVGRVNVSVEGLDAGVYMVRIVRNGQIRSSGVRLVKQ